jgi:formylglycine-generating enzyme required for sulfatase activity
MPVGSFPPNQWGIYDMHGNVWEWCWNRIDEDLPPQAPRFLERARVVRGGSYEYGCATINSWYRLGHKETRDGYMGPYGIRLVRNGGEP